MSIPYTVFVCLFVFLKFWLDLLNKNFGYTSRKDFVVIILSKFYFLGKLNSFQSRF